MSSDDFELQGQPVPNAFFSVSEQDYTSDYLSLEEFSFDIPMCAANFFGAHPFENRDSDQACTSNSRLLSDNEGPKSVFVDDFVQLTVPTLLGSTSSLESTSHTCYSACTEPETVDCGNAQNFHQSSKSQRLMDGTQLDTIGQGGSKEIYDAEIPSPKFLEYDAVEERSPEAFCEVNTSDEKHPGNEEDEKIRPTTPALWSNRTTSQVTSGSSIYLLEDIKRDDDYDMGILVRQEGAKRGANVSDFNIPAKNDLKYQEHMSHNVHELISSSEGSVDPEATRMMSAAQKMGFNDRFSSRLKSHSAEFLAEILEDSDHQSARVLSEILLNGASKGHAEGQTKPSGLHTSAKFNKMGQKPIENFEHLSNNLESEKIVNRNCRHFVRLVRKSTAYRCVKGSSPVFRDAAILDNTTERAETDSQSDRLKKECLSEKLLPHVNKAVSEENDRDRDEKTAGQLITSCLAHNENHGFQITHLCTDSPVKTNSIVFTGANDPQSMRFLTEMMSPFDRDKSKPHICLKVHETLSPKLNSGVTPQSTGCTGREISHTENDVQKAENQNQVLHKTSPGGKERQNSSIPIKSIPRSSISNFEDGDLRPTDDIAWSSNRSITEENDHKCGRVYAEETTKSICSFGNHDALRIRGDSEISSEEKSKVCVKDSEENADLPGMLFSAVPVTDIQQNPSIDESSSFSHALCSPDDFEKRIILPKLGDDTDPFYEFIQGKGTSNSHCEDSGLSEADSPTNQPLMACSSMSCLSEPVEPFSVDTLPKKLLFQFLDLNDIDHRIMNELRSCDETADPSDTKYYCSLPPGDKLTLVSYLKNKLTVQEMKNYWSSKTLRPCMRFDRVANAVREPIIKHAYKPKYPSDVISCTKPFGETSLHTKSYHIQKNVSMSESLPYKSAHSSAALAKQAPSLATKKQIEMPKLIPSINSVFVIKAPTIKFELLRPRFRLLVSKRSESSGTSAPRQKPVEKPNYNISRAPAPKLPFPNKKRAGHYVYLLNVYGKWYGWTGMASCG
ncbi:unnamed protein product [Calicophoron daubneyi]|uniref:Uncharacterized protein n=1 Tax=Calicophoron daubneyi TaxID=300641 RepID=A0AAV2U083_CALDB